MQAESELTALLKDLRPLLRALICSIILADQRGEFLHSIARFVDRENYGAACEKIAIHLHSTLKEEMGNIGLLPDSYQTLKPQDDE